MIVRALDTSHDWTFGKGRNNYLKDNAAVTQNLDTRLNCYLGNCFFDQAAGIDWFNILGSKDLQTAKLSIVTVILNTAFVKAVNTLSLNLDHHTREFSAAYQVQTSFSTVSGAFEFNANNEFG